MRKCAAAWGAVALIAFAVARTESSEKPSAPAVMTSVKDNRLALSFPDLTGETVSLADARFKGKVLLVDIWGTWCPPCREEIPFLKKMHEKYHDQGLEIISIAFEAPTSTARQKLAEFVKDHGIAYTVLHGGHRFEIAKKLEGVENFIGTPTAFFIGRDGRVKHVEGGFTTETSPQAIEAKIVELLKAP